MLIKPSNSLQERALLRILLDLLARVTSHRKAVNDTAVQIDLIRLLGLNEDLLGLVAFLGGEDLVGFCGCDGERAGNCCEFRFVDEAVYVALVTCYIEEGKGLTKDERRNRHRCLFLLA
jgi:hypothetical protein